MSVRAVGRSFRFAPTQQVRDSIDYLFALVASKYGLLVHEFLFMSNHFHLVATDPAGTLSDFLQEFNSLLSRQLNALRGTKGTNFEARPSIQIIADAGGILDKSVYTLVNPLAAHLVKYLRQWKASSSFGMDYGRPVTFVRPRCGLWAETLGPAPKGKHASKARLRYRGRSDAPETVTFELARPAVDMHRTSSELREEVRKRVADRERELIEERRGGGIEVLGWLNVVKQHYLAVPTTREPLFERRPRVTGRCSKACSTVLEKLTRFVGAYRAALELFRAGEQAVFPYGTLLMARRFGVECAPAPT